MIMIPYLTVIVGLNGLYLFRAWIEFYFPDKIASSEKHPRIFVSAHIFREINHVSLPCGSLRQAHSYSLMHSVGFVNVFFCFD